MNKQDFQSIINLVRRAPLANMSEAEAIAQLLNRFKDHGDEFLKLQPESNVEVIQPGGSE